MRDKHVCPKCKHNRILFIANVPDWGSVGPLSMNVAVVPQGTWHMGGEAKHKGVGHLHAFVCRRCGHTEFNTTNPASIPIDGDYVKELVGPEPEGPYR